MTGIDMVAEQKRQDRCNFLSDNAREAGLIVTSIMEDGDTYHLWVIGDSPWKHPPSLSGTVRELLDIFDLYRKGHR